MNGFASDTEVRVKRGDNIVNIAIGEVKVGDFLIDDHDMPVLCTDVTHFKADNLKEIQFTEFDSRKPVSFRCTATQKLSFVPVGTAPYLSGRRVSWNTRCSRNNLRNEAKLLNVDEFVSRLYRNYPNRDNDTVHNLVDAILGGREGGPYFERFLQNAGDLIDDADFRKALHQGVDRYSGNIGEGGAVGGSGDEDPVGGSGDRELDIIMDDCLRKIYQNHARDRDLDEKGKLHLLVEDVLFDYIGGFHKMESHKDFEDYLSGISTELLNDSALLREGLYEAVERNFDSLWAEYALYGSVDPDDGSGTDDGEWMSTDQSDDEISSDQEDQTGDSQDGRFEDTMELKLEPNFDARLAEVRLRLKKHRCRCKGFRQTTAAFIDSKQAQRALDYLLGDHPQLIDLECVCEWDDFSMSVADFEAMPHNHSKERLKLARAPLRYQPATNPSRGPSPLDALYGGMYLGDGGVNNGCIYGSDQEVEDWIEEYATRLNAAKKEDQRDVELKKRLMAKKGEPIEPGSSYLRNCDVFRYRISPVDGAEGKKWYPIQDGLRKLGIFDSKKTGIPKWYMNADEDTRLAVIAGLILTDGSYEVSHNRYLFAQKGPDHKKIVDDLRELAINCGICASEVYHYKVKRNEMYNDKYGPDSDLYIVALTEGCDRFQHHLIIPRKRMHPGKRFYTHDTRPIKMIDVVPDARTYEGPSEASQGAQECSIDCTAINVRGGRFLLWNRVVAIV
jgi:hypothetical protein